MVLCAKYFESYSDLKPATFLEALCCSYKSYNTLVHHAESKIQSKRVCNQAKTLVSSWTSIIHKWLSCSHRLRYASTISIGKQQTITLKMADQGRSDFFIALTMSFCALESKQTLISSLFLVIPP